MTWSTQALQIRPIPKQTRIRFMLPNMVDLLGQDAPAELEADPTEWLVSNDVVP